LTENVKVPGVGNEDEVEFATLDSELIPLYY